MGIAPEKEDKKNVAAGTAKGRESRGSELPVPTPDSVCEKLLIPNSLQVVLSSWCFSYCRTQCCKMFPLFHESYYIGNSTPSHLFYCRPYCKHALWFQVPVSYFSQVSQKIPRSGSTQCVIFLRCLMSIYLLHPHTCFTRDN